MWSDIRFALRTFLRQPAFTAVIVVTLAFGIGANTALFSIFNSVLLQDLPYPDPEQIYLVRSVTADGVPAGPPSHWSPRSSRQAASGTSIQRTCCGRGDSEAIEPRDSHGPMVFGE